jgi:hypothetical protein
VPLFIQAELLLLLDFSSVPDFNVLLHRSLNSKIKKREGFGFASKAILFAARFPYRSYTLYNVVCQADILNHFILSLTSASMSWITSDALPK